MNDETKAIIDRARELVAAAWPAPWTVRGSAAEDRVVNLVVLSRGESAPVGPTPHNSTGELVSCAPGLITTLCDALESAERRGEEAAARVADLESVRVEQAAKLRRHLDEIAELSALQSVAEARERRLERELLAIWATVRPGNPAPLTERDVLNAVEDVQSESVSLRSIIADCATAIANGSGCSTDASVESMAMVPAEIRAEVAALRDRAGIAEGREACAKANAEQMGGWLDARNAGLVQMARERDAALAELSAMRDAASDSTRVDPHGWARIRELESERDFVRRIAANRALELRDVWRMVTGEPLADDEVPMVIMAVRLMVERHDSFRASAERLSAETVDLRAALASVTAELAKVTAVVARQSSEVNGLTAEVGCMEHEAVAASDRIEWLRTKLAAATTECTQLRAEADALRIERDVADRECDRLRAQVDADRQELTRLDAEVKRLKLFEAAELQRRAIVDAMNGGES